jgi:NADH:ubiquinone oxidoreductase subunit E
MRTPADGRLVLRICHGHACARAGLLLAAAARRYIAERQLHHAVTVERANCSGQCQLGPNVFVEASGECAVPAADLAPGGIIHGATAEGITMLIEDQLAL